MVPDGKENVQFTSCLDVFRKEYAKIAQNKTKPYAGIPALLDTLCEKGYHVAVVSNKFHDAVVSLVQQYFPQIPHAAGEREALGIRKKPAPDTVFAIMEEIGVSADECVYIGDSEVDIFTAKNAGMDCITVTWGFRDKAYLKEQGAVILADTVPELLAAIEQGKKNI